MLRLKFIFYFFCYNTRPKIAMRVFKKRSLNTASKKNIIGYSDFLLNLHILQLHFKKIYINDLNIILAVI